MSGWADSVDATINRLRTELTTMDVRAQLKLLNEATGAVAHLRTEIDTLRAEALRLLVEDVQLGMARHVDRSA
jgi:hypothetical protein